MNSAWTEFTQTRSLPALEAQALGQTALFSPCSDDALLKVTGEDATEFLHSQVSSDVKNLEVGSSQLSSYSSAKGMVYAQFRIYRLEQNEYLLRLPRSLTVSVGKRLKMYVLRAQVEITVDESAGVLLIAGDIETALQALGHQLPAQPRQFFTNSAATVLRLADIPHDRQPISYCEVILNNESLSSAWQALAQTHKAHSPDVADLLRILSGEAQLGPGTSERFVAQNLNLQLTGGISFKKGCYPGQEYIAKTQYRGRLRSQLFRLCGNTTPENGAELFAQEGSKTSVGTVLSAAWDGHAYQAAAVIKLKTSESGSVCDASGNTFEIHSYQYS